MNILLFLAFFKSFQMLFVSSNCWHLIAFSSWISKPFFALCCYWFQNFFFQNLVKSIPPPLALLHITFKHFVRILIKHTKFQRSGYLTQPVKISQFFFYFWDLGLNITYINNSWLYVLERHIPEFENIQSLQFLNL